MKLNQAVSYMVARAEFENRDNGALNKKVSDDVSENKGLFHER